MQVGEVGGKVQEAYRQGEAIVSCGREREMLVDKIVLREQKVVVVTCDITVDVLRTYPKGIVRLQGSAPTGRSITHESGSGVCPQASDRGVGGIAQFFGNEKIVIAGGRQPSLRAWLQHEGGTGGHTVIVGGQEIACKACVVLVELDEMIDHSVPEFGVERDVVVLFVSSDLCHKAIGILATRIADGGFEVEFRHLVFRAGVDTPIRLQCTVLQRYMPQDMVLVHTVSATESILLGTHTAADSIASEIRIQQVIVGILDPFVFERAVPCVGSLSENTADAIDVVDGSSIDAETSLRCSKQGHCRLPIVALQIRLCRSSINKQRGYYDEKNIQAVVD